MIVFLREKLGLNVLDIYMRTLRDEKGFDIFFSRAEGSTVMAVLGKNGTKKPEPSDLAGLFGIEKCHETDSFFLDNPNDFMEAWEYFLLREHVKKFFVPS